MNIEELLLTDSDIDKCLVATANQNLLRGGRAAVYIYHEGPFRVYHVAVRRWDQSQPYAAGDPAAEYLATVWKSHDPEGVIPIVYVVPAGSELSERVKTGRAFTAVKLHLLPWRDRDEAWCVACGAHLRGPHSCVARYK